MPLLEVDDLQVFYGDFQALFGIGFTVAEGRTVSIIGANGAGKSTFLRALIGINREKKGKIVFDGADITNERAHTIARRGISIVPEGRRLFPSLTVEENLLTGTATGRRGPWTVRRVFELFPMLGDLRHQVATRISGGQQQMVAIGRALLANPRILLCDELSLGLAPRVINGIYTQFDEIRRSGVSILLVEQDVVRACSAADDVYCFLEGRVSLQGPARDFSVEEISRAYFGT
ncbi:MAG: ABC transporter ATP-binding protein [Rhodospirillales bacterium]|nr:ABC transporter ATP-binding protein [Rhodospirillales bacterium]